MSNYTFTSAFPPDHFVSEYIAYASQRCDAAHEYHEGLALIALATATSDVSANIKQFPDGLRTNLYVVLVGSTSRSRKTTAMEIGLDIIKRVFPFALLPNKATPEAFAEAMTQQAKRPALFASDEYAALLKQIHRREFLAGLESLLLELYQRPHFTYNRTKGNVVIADAHLSIVGCAADTVFNSLHQDDVESGLLPRHAIIFPQDKPDYMPFSALANENLQARNDLVVWLNNIAPQQRDQEGRYLMPRDARITSDAFDRLAGYARNHEDNHTGEMQRRIVPMALKLAMLSAAGARDAFRLTPDLIVTAEDVERAIVVTTRWAQFAEDFARRMGESQHEKHVRATLAWLGKKNVELVARRVVMRAMHFDANAMDAVEKTLHGRGHIELETDGKEKIRGRFNVWRWLDFKKSDAA